VTVRDSDQALRLIRPEQPMKVYTSFQMKVADRTGKVYPAVFSKDYPDMDDFTVSPDGFLQAGYYTELPALQDEELVMTWEITHQSSEDAFRMEGNKIDCLKAGEREAQASLSCGVIGKHAVYFEFLCPEGTEAEFDWFTFDRD